MELLSNSDKKVFILLDPDSGKNYSDSFFLGLEHSIISAVLVGGSLVLSEMDEFIDYIRSKTNLPIWIFPGSFNHVSEKADGLLLLGLLSGRNSEYLIGEHVKSAYRLKKSKLKIVSTGYILIDGGNETSVSYMSNTRPIPADKTDIIVSTVLAAELIGYKQIYLEAGSGARKTVPLNAIKQVSKHSELPLIVGGGVREVSSITEMFAAGANAVVLGSVLEDEPTFIQALKEMTV